ncbi:TPA: hypothetical protein HA295_00465 [Candidatus Woesearchaeota archaeon]|nr:hypothetical protein [Candidatus Woesearchaeota archaeon]HII65232.1 hypothetical protein [Candidatus Woesearchaeota archaeon]
MWGPQPNPLPVYSIVGNPLLVPRRMENGLYTYEVLTANAGLLVAATLPAKLMAKQEPGAKAETRYESGILRGRLHIKEFFTVIGPIHGFRYAPVQLQELVDCKYLRETDYAAVFTLYGRYLKKSTSPNPDSAVGTGNGDAGADPWVFDSLEALIDSVRKDPRKAHVVTLSGFDEVYLMKPTGDTGKTGSGRLLWRPKLITSPVPGMP